jgi:hypothetical protein
MDATISRYTWARPPSVVDLSAILAAQSAPHELALETAVAAVAAAQAASQSATGSPSDQAMLDLYL